MQIRMYDPFVGFACHMEGGAGWQQSRTGEYDGCVDYCTTD